MTRRRLIAGIALTCIAAAAVAWWVLRARSDATIRVVEQPIEVARGVQLATRTFVPDGASARTPAPAVLLAHGLGDDQSDVRRMAGMLTRHGYLVRTWNARGERGSDGAVGIAAPTGEVADVSALLDELATRADVQRDADGDPRVGVVGISHGAGTALLAAARDRRIDALVPIFGWGSLERALTPNQVLGVDPRAPGVLKLGWASVLFAAGTGSRRPADPCGALDPAVCAAWTRAADAGAFDPRGRRLLAERSPIGVIEDVRAPTLFVQGQMDSLFDLQQVVPLARALTRASVPTRVEWVRAGHDAAPARATQEHVDQAMRRWLDRWVRRQQGVDTGPRFTVQLGAGRGYANAPEIPPRTTEQRIGVEPESRARDGYVRIVTPPRGLPADTTTLPGLGDVTGFASVLATPEGQRARFTSEPVQRGLEVVGSPRVTLHVRGSVPTGDLFVHLVDVGSAQQQVIPRGLVAPIRIDDVPPLSAATPRRVTVDLPPIAYRFAPGHRIALAVATTDAGYDARFAPATWDVTVVGPLSVPRAADLTRSAETFDAGTSAARLGWYALAIAVLALLTGGGILYVRSRGASRVHEPHLRDVPIAATGLTKRYPRTARPSVAGIDLRVERGTVVGIVGPNGAGKTSIMRMLLGLVRPTDGAAWIFGQLVRPGASHLERVGAMIDGPGLLPHVTFEEHLRHYARAAGRPADRESLAAALASADLTQLAAQRVRTASHGMRQRLGIAQALLGSPDIVILDEPTNGLDPAQIRHVRGLITALAAEGRTVLVASHVLAELERVCTHVILLARGEVLASGSVRDVIGAHDDLEAAFLAAVEEHDRA